MEIEAMALAGVASPIVLAFTSASLSLLLPVTISVTLLSVSAIILTAVITSYIDADFAAAINKEIIP